MSYKNLEIWKLSRELVLEIHEITIKKIPNYEIYEEGSQIRRSSKSTKSNIVEDYSRRKYKREFLTFLIYAMASNNETIDHLENLFETRSLIDTKSYSILHKKLETLGKKINLFIKSVETCHKSIK